MVRTERCIIQRVPILPQAINPSLAGAGCGGYVCFMGIVRNSHHGQKVLKLEYECYEPLAQKELDSIVSESIAQFGLWDARVIHRIGTIDVEGIAVMIETWSPHRKEAFSGCQYIIDELKQRVPIWKKEFFADGSASWAFCHSH